MTMGTQLFGTRDSESTLLFLDRIMADFTRQDFTLPQVG
jgi:hypothetical protein